MTFELRPTNSVVFAERMRNSEARKQQELEQVSRPPSRGEPTQGAGNAKDRRHSRPAKTGRAVQRDMGGSMKEQSTNAADLAFELLETKTPHQLAVELVAAIDARDQYIDQLKDATQQCAVMAELLSEARDMMGNKPRGFTDIIARIDAALAGKVPVHVGDSNKMVVPMQPIILDPTGRPRFKKNSAVEYLAEGRLNEIASRGYSDEDMTQLAQLIGYSLSGFSELSYVSDEDYERAVIAAPKSEGGEV